MPYGQKITRIYQSLQPGGRVFYGAFSQVKFVVPLAPERVGLGPIETVYMKDNRIGSWISV